MTVDELLIVLEVLKSEGYGDYVLTAWKGYLPLSTPDRIERKTVENQGSLNMDGFLEDSVYRMETEDYRTLHDLHDKIMRVLSEKGYSPTV